MRSSGKQAWRLAGRAALMLAILGSAGLGFGPAPVQAMPGAAQSVDLWQTPTMDLYSRATALPGWGLRLAHPDDTAMRTAFRARGVDFGEVRQPRPWDADLEAEPPQHNGAAAAWLRSDGSEQHAALVALRRRNGPDDDDMLFGTDFVLPLGSSRVKLRGEALGSVATARPGIDAAPRGAPELGDHHLQLALSQQAGAVESSLVFEELRSGRRNELGVMTQAGVRRLTGESTRVWHDLGSFDKLSLYVFATDMRTLDASIGVHRAVRPGVSFEHKSGLRVTGELRAAEWLRARPDGLLHAERYLHLDVEAQPGAWLPLLHVALDAGRLVDVAADEPGMAHRASLGAELRMSDLSTLGLSLQRQVDGPSHSRQDFAQFELNHALTPGLDLHLVGTQHRTSRSLPAAINARERVMSLALRRRWSPSCAFYAGITGGRNDGASGRPGSTTAFYLQIVHRMDQ